MQAFWARLRELRASAGSLDVAEYQGHQFQVINPGGELHFPGVDGVKQVLRRSCYEVAHRAIRDMWAAPRERASVIISGTSGKFDA